jgi:ABC-2 type transport system permease protein
MRPPNLRRIAAIATVEAKRLVGDRMLLGLLLLLPIVQVMLYGYAINLNPQHLKVALATNDAHAIQPMLDQAKGERAIDLTGPVGGPGSAEQAVRSGKAVIGIEADRRPDGQPPRVQVFADAGDPQTVREALAVLQTRIWKGVADNYAGEQAPAVDVRWLSRNASSPTINLGWSVAPGLVGMIVMITMLFLGALTLVREREAGSWESLLATPVTPADALIGKLAPYLVIGVFDTVVLLLAVHWLFDLPLPPSTWALVAAAPIFAGAYLILGFAFSAIAQTQMQAAQGAALFYLPSLLLSGFLFPFEGMPAWARALGYAMPLTHYLRATRDVLIRGAGPLNVAEHMVPVLVFEIVASAVAILAYRRRLD